MTFKIIPIFLLIFTFLFCNPLVSLNAQTDSTVICTFTMGSNEVVINNNGETNTKKLCLPVGIDPKSNRATIDHEGFMQKYYPQFEIEYNVLIKEDKTMEIFHSFYTKKTEVRQLTLIYPYDKGFFYEGSILYNYNKIPEEDRIKLPFAIYKVDNEKAHFKYTYILPLRLLFENTGHTVDWNPEA